MRKLCVNVLGLLIIAALAASPLLFGAAPAEAGQQRAPVCHVGHDNENSEVPTYHTLYLPHGAVAAHLRHGDAAGACPSPSPSPAP